MAQDTFLVALKSTLDKKAKALAVLLGVDYVDLDDTTASEAFFKTEVSGVMLEFGTFAPDPSDPLYQGAFHIGARTVEDPANYEMLTLIGKVSSLFPKGERIQIYEEFDTLQGPLVGILTPGDIEAMPQQYELLSGLRMVNIQFRAQRLV